MSATTYGCRLCWRRIATTFRTRFLDRKAVLALNPIHRAAAALDEDMHLNAGNVEFGRTM